LGAAAGSSGGVVEEVSPMLDLAPIVRVILDDYTLPRHGIHGITHWARVLETGVRLAGPNGANVDVVRLFAVFHDCQRVTQQTDPSHGVRGATFAAEMRGKLFDLNDDDFDLLYVACVGHMDHPTDDDPTVQTCWDADRLDLGRVGGKIDPSWLGAATVAQPAIMEWAHRQASDKIIPDLIRRDWGIRTDRWKKPQRAGSERKPR
jgi:uncharacterized protein